MSSNNLYVLVSFGPKQQDEIVGVYKEIFDAREKVFEMGFKNALKSEELYFCYNGGSYNVEIVETKVGDVSFLVNFTNLNGENIYPAIKAIYSNEEYRME